MLFWKLFRPSEGGRRSLFFFLLLSLPFLKFASNEAIQRTEAYEYAQSLGTQPCPLPNFQVCISLYMKSLGQQPVPLAHGSLEVLGSVVNLVAFPGCFYPESC